MLTKAVKIDQLEGIPDPGSSFAFSHIASPLYFSLTVFHTECLEEASLTHDQAVLLQAFSGAIVALG